MSPYFVRPDQKYFYCGALLEKFNYFAGSDKIVWDSMLVREWEQWRVVPGKHIGELRKWLAKFMPKENIILAVDLYESASKIERLQAVGHIP